MVIVRVAAWLMAAAPADADTETMLVPTGVPGFFRLLLPELHAASPIAPARRSKLKSLTPPKALLRRAVNPNTIARTGGAIA